MTDRVVRKGGGDGCLRGGMLRVFERPRCWGSGKYPVWIVLDGATGGVCELVILLS
jgi:hypothetical protein